MPDNIDAPTPVYRAEFEAAIVQRALDDSAFWNALVQDATRALAEYFGAQGKTMPAGITVTAKVEDAQTFYHVIADPAYFAPSLRAGASSLNPRESFHARTDYLLTIQDTDPDTGGLSIAELEQALAAAQTAFDAANDALNRAEAQAGQDANAMNQAWADLQDAQTAARVANAALADDPDDPQRAAAATQADDALTAAQSAYDQASDVAVASQNAAVLSGGDYASASAALDAAQRALFQANFAADPVTAATQAFNTSMPFATEASQEAQAQADADLAQAREQAASQAAASDQASQAAVQADRELQGNPDDPGLQAAASAAADQAQASSDAAADAATREAEATVAAAQAAAAARGVDLVVLDEAADGTLYLVLPYAPHQSAFMGPYSVQFADGAYAVYPVPTPDLMPAGRMAVEVWMQSAGFDASRQDVLVSLGNAGAGWQLDCRGGRVTLMLNLVADGVTTPCTVQQPQSVPALAEGRWHYIAGVYDGQTLQLYVDGRWVAQSAASGTLAPYGGCLVLGRNADLANDNSHFNGLLHEVRLWGDALAPTQIADNRNQMQEPSAIPEAAQALLMAHYEFADGAGTGAVDSSPHRRDLSLQAGASWLSTGLRSPG
ncbi:MAG: hypothetical protein KF740_15710 [Ramlibacter sp.]|nr:hypothetical protein [Ramlibacter sp.]